MGILWSCCCDNEAEGIVGGRDPDRQGLLTNPEVYAPSLSVSQYNNAGQISASHNGSGDGEVNGSLRTGQLQSQN